MSAFDDFAGDRARYGVRSWLSDRTIYAIAAFRLGQWIDESCTGVVRKLARQMHTSLGMFVSAFTGIELVRGAQIGPGLRIFHGTGVVVNPGTRIGRNCTILQGVTLGSRRGTDAPTLGDDIEIGAHAAILGEVTLGDGAHVGAGAIVIADVPERANVAGNPARILRIRDPAVSRNSAQDRVA
jgi:serine O-acetyltransferase